VEDRENYLMKQSVMCRYFFPDYEWYEDNKDKGMGMMNNTHSREKIPCGVPGIKPEGKGPLKQHTSFTTEYAHWPANHALLR
jgi:hypothetical protein